MSLQATEKRKETLASMCDERAWMLQDQFNVSMNHIQAMSILISTFHHAKNPSAIDQALYGRRFVFNEPQGTSVSGAAVRYFSQEYPYWQMRNQVMYESISELQKKEKGIQEQNNMLAKKVSKNISLYKLLICI